MAERVELRGRLTLNDALFHTGLRRAEGAIKRFASQPIAQLGGAVAGLFTVDAFKEGIKGAIELGDNLWKLNKATGISVGSLGALQEVSALTGVELGQVAKGVGFMQRNLVNAMRGQGQGESALRLLKLDAQDLVGLKPEVAFQRIGVAINALPDPALRTAIAMRLFGKAGRELLPFFSEIGKANFANLSDRSRLLQENAEKFHEATIEFRQAEMNLKTSFLGIGIGFINGIKPVLEAFKGFNFAKIGESWGKQLADGMKNTFSVVKVVSEGGPAKDDYWKRIGKAAPHLAEAIGQDIIGIFDQAGSFIPGKVGKWFSKKSSERYAMRDAAYKEADRERDGAVAGARAAAGLSGGDTPVSAGRSRAPYISPLDGKSMASGFDFFSQHPRSWPDSRSAVLDAKMTNTAWRRAHAVRDTGDTATKSGWNEVDMLISGMRGKPSGHGASLSPLSTFGKGSLSTGNLSMGAYGQRGGLGSMAKWDTKAIMGLGTGELLNNLFSESERQGITNQIVAAGGERPTTSPNAYGAVAAGDQQRRTAYIREQVRAKVGVDKSNELLQAAVSTLQSIDQSTGETVDELSD